MPAVYHSKRTSLAGSLKNKSRGPVHFKSDGLLLSPANQAELLIELTSQRPIVADNYTHGGAVAECEKRFALALGKESALFFPTGILANHLSIRHLAQARPRVLVQAASHLYGSSVDCVQRLSGINLVPLAQGRATFTLAEVKTAISQSQSPPHPVSVGAISIESPVRRFHGEVFAFDELQRISRYAREHGIGLHLDGARLFAAAAYTGISPASYAALFDTVYVSTYKSFNAPQGAILAGSAEFIRKIAPDRKLFGADVYQAWPSALVANHFLQGFARRFASAKRKAQILFQLLNRHPRLRIEPVSRGSNVFKLHVTGIKPEAYTSALAKRGLAVRTQSAAEEFDGVWLIVNESLNFQAPAEVAAIFIDALS